MENYTLEELIQIHKEWCRRCRGFTLKEDSLLRKAAIEIYEEDTSTFIDQVYYDVSYTLIEKFIEYLEKNKND